MKKAIQKINLRNITGILLVLFFLLPGFNGIAQPLLVEDFDYPVGDLLTAHGWTEHSGGTTGAIAVSAGLTFPGYAGSGLGGAAYLINNGQDVNKTFAEQTTGVVYASFIVQTEATNYQGYFLHFGQSAMGTILFTRIYVNASGTGIGLGLGNTAPTNYSAVTPGTPALVVIKLDIATKVSSFYLFNSFPGSEPAVADLTVTETASFSNVGSIGLRQFNNSQKVIVDGIRVATTWEDVVAGSGGGNLPPSITNIIQTPASGITPATTVSVSADIVDSDGTIASAKLKWGTLSGTLPNIINMTVGSGDTYTTVSSIPAQADGTTVYYTITATDDDAAATTSPEQSYVVSSPATKLVFSGFPATGTTGQAVLTFTVEAQKPDNSVDPGFTEDITLSIATGTGTLGGTLMQTAVAGVATFNNITFSDDGSYTLHADAAGLTQATSGSIVISSGPAITAAVLPLYVSGSSPSNSRIPFAYRATLSNLLPNATYRYINQLVIDTDLASSNGAGNPIYVAADGTFTTTSNAGLSTPGQYGEFTTNASGEFTGWFMNVPTGNTRFTPGNQIFARIALNNGAGGTSAVNRVTSADYMTVLAFNTTASDGTAIRGISNATPKNFVFLYDNIAGTGRPLWSSSVEVTGVDFSATSYALFYRSDVYNTNGSWGGIVPNMNANGVRRIEERALATGAIVGNETSADGVWGATNTVNPTGGIAEVLVIDLAVSTDPLLTVTPSELTGFFYSEGNGPSSAQTYTLKGVNLVGSGNIVVAAPANYEISLNGTTYLANLNIPFAAGNITNQPVTISVRLKAGLITGMFNDELISHTGGGAPLVNVTCSGMVQFVNFATIPYTESFTADLGLCSPISVAGDTKVWEHNSLFGTASMSGLISGELEEDWLILPGINLVANTNIGLKFDSWMRYGIDNANNYFKLLYSINYPGFGDPNAYTWTELPFTYPAEEITWTPSGNVDLSAISSQPVFIAFKYHYNNGFYRSWQIDNIEIAEVVAPGTLAVTPESLSGFTYVEGAGPSAVKTYQLSGTGLDGTGNITVTAPADYEISSNGTTFATSLNYAFAAGVITGQPVTVSVRLKAGLAEGNYNGQTIINSGGGASNKVVTCSGTVTSGSAPSIASETIPQWMQGMNSSNNTRLPYAFRIGFAGLNPNATYRYINQAAIGTDSPTVNGAGNPIYVNADGTFTRVSSTSLATAGGYGEFITDANGAYSGWFAMEATANARFTPGNLVYMRIALNDGNEGTSVATRLTSTTAATIINFGTGSEVIQGTGIRGISNATPKNFVFLYDNVAGTGRPLYGTSIETTGIDYAAANSFVPFYSTEVQGNNGSWGGIVPNVNANGVRLIEERSRTTGEVVDTDTSANGVWGTIDTRNPVGGTTNILVIDLAGSTPTPLITVNPSTLSGFTYITGNGPSAVQTYVLSATNLVGTGNVTVTAPANYEVSSNGTAFSSSLSYAFASGIVTGQPVTVSVRLKAGLAVGGYNAEAIVNIGGGATEKVVTCSGSVTSTLEPGIVSETIPQWMQGVNGTNNLRLPYAFRLSFANLNPNATYRYTNQAVIDTDTPTSGGAGIAIYVDADGTFRRVTSTSLSTAGGYGEFTTDATGAFAGWFAMESSGNARFTPGNVVFMRVILNDGNEGTSAVTRLTSTTSATIINFGVESNVAQGTGIRGISTANAKNFVFLYDNVAGTGRPLYGTSIETTGIDYAAVSSIAPFYSGQVQGNNGSWGGIVPNVNANGVRLIEERSRTTGLVVDTDTSANGVWGTTDTRNPVGGAATILVIDLTGGTPTPILTVNPSTLSGFTYLVGSGPSAIQTYVLSGTNLEGTGNVTVTAPTNYEVSSNGTAFSSSLTYPIANGIVSGQPVTVSVRLKAGLAVGGYNAEAIVNIGGGATEKVVTCSGSVTSTLEPGIASETIPQWMQGINSGNNSRLPYAFRIGFTNLNPSATYRYINQAVIETDSPTVNGAGNPIYINADGTFNRVTSTSLATAGGYGEFITDASGAYNGWFAMEATANARFTPGNSVYMRIALNDGNEGTTVVKRLTSTTAATIINFGTGSEATQGTGIRGISNATPKNFVFLYDNVAGTGRPLYGTSIETTGIDFAAAGSYVPFYGTEVQGNDGSWGGIVPNLNANGVRLIEERSRTTGLVVDTDTSVDGVWGTTDTRNPVGGTATILVIDLTGGTPTPMLTVNPSTLSGFTYLEGSGPSAIQTYVLSGTNLEGTGNVTVTAPANYEVSSNGTAFSASLTYPFANGIVTGQPVTVSVRLKAGLVIGEYNAETIVNAGGGATNKVVTCNGSVTSTLEPGIASEIVPLWIQGINSNNQRLPFAFRLSLSNLSPNATYRYFNQAVIETDAVTVNGAGNPIFVNVDGTFVRTTSSSLATPGGFGEFITNASGSYSGWFILETTGNARFTPGNNVFMRLMLNDGNDGTAVATRLTSTAAAGVINFGTESDVLMGTGIRGISNATPKNFVFLYDNVAKSGRPLFGSSIETTGIDFAAANSYVPFYGTEVQGNDGSWGGIVPNVNASGVRLIEERSLATGEVVNTNTSADGVWGTTDTRNPSGGAANVLVVDLSGSTPTPMLTVNPSTLNGFSYLLDNGPSAIQTYLLNGTNLEGSGNVSVTAPASYEVSSDGNAFGETLSYPFANGIITGQPITVSVRLKAGLDVGEYNAETIVNAGGGATNKVVTCNGSVTTQGQPGLAEVTLPLFIEGMNGSNNNRVPLAYRASLVNLAPNVVYRFYNKMVVEADAADFNGAGNCVFVGENGTFSRTTSTSLATPGEYGEFTTDASGSYSGWFISEPTANARFTPGNEVFMRFMLNDGNEGTTVAHRFTTDDFVTVLQFGTEADPTHGTAIRGFSENSPKNFVFLYDNVGGNGRPLYGAHIESTEVDFGGITSYASFYVNDVAGDDGSWGGIVPNMNPAGVQRLEVRSLADADIVKTYEVPSGVWINTDTRNPNGGVGNVLVLDLINVSVLNPGLKGVNIYSFGKELTIEASSADQYEFSLINIQGQSLMTRKLSGSDRYVLPVNVPTGIYIVKLVGTKGISTAKVYVR